MSRYLKAAFAALAPYVPGEQPRERKYIKLNTNESPYPPPQKVADAALEAAKTLRLYSDPESHALRAKAAEVFGVGMDEILMTNGSDEALNFAFMAFGDAEHPFVFPNHTYGFYSVLCRANGIPFRTIPLNADFTVNTEDYLSVRGHIVLANPNAPTGIALKKKEIERILQADESRVVIVDEAYADFSDENCLDLIHTYENLLIVRTFSKSRSLAGARLGFAVGQAALIADLNRVKNAVNPYNVNSMTALCGIAALDEEGYYREMCSRITRQRERTAADLRALGFTVLPSSTNFLFASTAAHHGKWLYARLKENGILVRHFDQEGIREYLRITIGTEAEMDAFLQTLQRILKEAEGA